MNVEKFPLHFKDRIGPPLQASKWLKCPVLLDVSEMDALLSYLGDFRILAVGGIVPVGEGEIDRSSFLESYGAYVEDLKQGKVPDDLKSRLAFSSAWTIDLDAAYAVKVGEGSQIIKIEEPVIQLQPHRFDYSLTDGNFRSMVFGSDTIVWGIQFSYPQLFADKDLKVMQVRETSEFPNTALFKRLQRWVREHTRVTPFLIEGKRKNIPIRLGKRCFEWINRHPQFSLKNLKVIE